MGDSYNSMVSNLQKSSQQAKDKQRKEFSPAIRKCQYMGCPMSASSITSAGSECIFHDGPAFHQDKTESIIANQRWIKGYNDMVRWETEDWNSQKTWLENNPQVPMGENEPLSVWLNRYFQWVMEKINTDATDITNNRLGHH